MKHGTIFIENIKVSTYRTVLKSWFIGLREKLATKIM